MTLPAGVTIDITNALVGIGGLMAAATHDLKTANPADVGFDGVPIRAWRSAYAEDCKDMANKIASGLPEDLQSQIKAIVMAAFNAEFARLDTPAVSPGTGDTP